MSTRLDTPSSSAWLKAHFAHLQWQSLTSPSFRHQNTLQTNKKYCFGSVAFDHAFSHVAFPRYIKQHRPTVSWAASTQGQVREGIVLLYAVLVRPHQQYCIQAWQSQNKTWSERSRSRECHKDAWSLEHLSYKYTPKELGLISLKRRGKPHCGLPVL